MPRMRVAALYDIHGNLPALEAVLEQVLEAGVDHIVVGGDVVPGPMPRETIQRLLDLDLPVRFIYGNGEVAVLEQMAGGNPAAVPEPLRPAMRWTAEQLRDDRPRLAAWPKTVRDRNRRVGRCVVLSRHPARRQRVFHAVDIRREAAAGVQRSRRRRRCLRPYAHAVRPHGRRGPRRERGQRGHAVRRTRR